MKYQKVFQTIDQINRTKFVTKNQVEINDDARGTYNTNSQIKFDASMFRSSLCDYSGAYILVSGTKTAE